MCQTLHLGSRFAKVSKGGPHLSVNTGSAKDNKSMLQITGSFIAAVLARHRGAQGRGAQLHGWVREGHMEREFPRG